MYSIVVRLSSTATRLFGTHHTDHSIHSHDDVPARLGGSSHFIHYILLIMEIRSTRDTFHFLSSFIKLRGGTLVPGEGLESEIVNEKNEMVSDKSKKSMKQGMYILTVFRWRMCTIFFVVYSAIYIYGGLSISLSQRETTTCHYLPSSFPPTQ